MPRIIVSDANVASCVPPENSTTKFVYGLADALGPGRIIIIKVINIGLCESLIIHNNDNI